jgi:hypothetical protein
MAPPLQREEQGRRHFALQLIPGVRRHFMHFRRNLSAHDPEQVRWLDLLAERAKIFLGANAGEA